MKRVGRIRRGWWHPVVLLRSTFSKQTMSSTGSPQSNSLGEIGGTPKTFQQNWALGYRNNRKDQSKSIHGSICNLGHHTKPQHTVESFLTDLSSSRKLRPVTLRQIADSEWNWVGFKVDNGRLTRNLKLESTTPTKAHYNVENRDEKYFLLFTYTSF